MFKNLLTFSLLLCCVNSYAQVAAISMEKMNVVYAGIGNPLTIVAEHYDCRNLVVTTDNGEIRGELGHYEYQPDKPPKAIITVSVKTKTGLKKLKEFNYRVKSIPAPTPRLADKKGGYISRAQLCVQIAPAASLGGFDIDAKFVITKFKVVVTRDAGIIFETTLSDERGTRFDEKTKSIFCSLRKDDVVWLTDMVCRGASGIVTDIDDLKFTIE